MLNIPNDEKPLALYLVMFISIRTPHTNIGMHQIQGLASIYMVLPNLISGNQIVGCPCRASDVVDILGRPISLVATPHLISNSIYDKRFENKPQDVVLVI